MGKFTKSLILLMLVVPLWGMESIVKSNAQLIQKTERGFISLQTSDVQPIYANKPGEPAIPLTHHFFRIPANSSIESINIIPIDVSHKILAAPLMPVQKAYPLSYEGTPEFISPNEAYDQRSSFPVSYLSHFGDGYSGGIHIGYVTYYTAQYEPITKTLYQPSQFRIEINYANDRSDPAIYNNVVTNDVLSTLGIDTPIAVNDTTGYLLIYPASFASAYAPLVEWRKKQGLRVLTQTIEFIDSNMNGADIQEKLRYYIYTRYLFCDISYVTLGADVGLIPDRKFFAFDCQFGYMEDENDLPADMYYANLDGDWDFNQNGVYGEDGDNPDYFPEIYVGRISANNETEVTDYVNRLLAYEQGHLPNYNKSLGFSMDLWEGSNSVLCQQYILQQYFPSNYQNTVLNQEENNTANALNAMNQNPNIVQHTGHASKDVIALRHGYINNNFMTQLNNDYGGLFYSIGCWAEAIDYSSIGEKMVMTPGKGMLSFVGNSRFGWGAPIAAGFGYSEFFQKEFFRLLFQNNINHIGATNALQKIPFIPYFNGTSVYKWCAYELNEEGDSYFRLFTDNPKPMTYHVTGYGNQSVIIVVSEGIPISNATIYFADNNMKYTTELNGNAWIPSNQINKPFSIYAEGYQAVTNAIFSNTEDAYVYGFYLFNSQDNDLTQGTVYNGGVTISNTSDATIDITVELQTTESTVEIDNPTFTLQLAANTMQSTNFSCIVKSIQDSRQLPNGYPIPVTVKLTYMKDDSLQVITRTFDYHVLAPNIETENISIETDAIIPGATVPFTIRFTQNAARYLYHAEVTLFSNIVSFESHEQDIYLGEIPIDSLHTMGFIGNFMTVPRTISNGEIIPIHVDVKATWNEQIYHFVSDIQVAVGQLNYYNDFQESLGMTGDPEWQRTCPDPSWGEVNLVSLSCRPTQYGTYTISSPDFMYQDNTKVSFDYYYKMPMYGQDGVFIKLVHNNESENLLFLGSGGALGRPADGDYITSDWAQYELDLSTLPLSTLEVGDLYHLEFSFVYADTVGLNNYSVMPEVGVFIDNLKVSNDDGDIQNQDFDVPAIQIHTFPNPLEQSDILKIDLLSWNNTTYKMDIYNIRGQRVYNTNGAIEGPMVKRLLWNQADSQGHHVASGIYILKVKAGNKEVIRKFTVLK